MMIKIHTERRHNFYTWKNPFKGKNQIIEGPKIKDVNNIIIVILYQLKDCIPDICAGATIIEKNIVTVFLVFALKRTTKMSY